MKLPFRPFYYKHLLTFFLQDVLILLKFFIVVNGTIAPGRTGIAHYKSHCLIQPLRTSTKSSPYKNIPLTVAQHFPARRRTLSCMYKNILLTAAQDFMAQYRLFCKHTTHKNTIELFSNIETCFTIFLPFVVHSLIIIFYKGLNFVYFPV